MPIVASHPNRKPCAVTRWVIWKQRHLIGLIVETEGLSNHLVGPTFWIAFLFQIFSTGSFPDECGK